MKKIALIASNTFREAIRQRFFAFLILIAAGLLGSSLFFRQFDFGSGELRFIADFGFGGIFLFGTILAVVMTAQLFFSEIENRTAITLLAKPVRRGEFIVGKYLGIALLLLLFTAVMLGLLGLLLGLREYQLTGTIGGQVSYGGLLIFALLQWIKLSLIASITLFIASYARSNLFSAFASFVFVLMCQLQYIALQFWGTIENSLLRGIVWTLAKFFPNSQFFNVGQALVFPANTSDLQTASTMVAIYGTAYIGLFLLLAIYAFTNLGAVAEK